MLAAAYLYNVFTMFMYGFDFWSFQEFYHKWLLIFFQMFSQHPRKKNEFFLSLWVCLYSGLCWWISIYWTIPACLDEAYLFKMNDCFDVLLDLFVRILLNIFSMIFIRKMIRCTLCCVFVWFRYKCKCVFIEGSE